MFSRVMCKKQQNSLTFGIINGIKRHYKATIKVKHEKPRF